MKTYLFPLPQYGCNSPNYKSRDHFFPHLRRLKILGVTLVDGHTLCATINSICKKTKPFFPSDTLYNTFLEKCTKATMLQSLVNIKTNAYSIYIPSFTQA